MTSDASWSQQTMTKNSFVVLVGAVPQLDTPHAPVQACDKKLALWPESTLKITVLQPGVATKLGALIF